MRNLAMYMWIVTVNSFSPMINLQFGQKTGRKWRSLHYNFNTSKWKEFIMFFGKICRSHYDFIDIQMHNVSARETEADQYNQQFLRSINHLTPSMITGVQKFMHKVFEKDSDTSTSYKKIGRFFLYWFLNI